MKRSTGVAAISTDRKQGCKLARRKKLEFKEDAVPFDLEVPADMPLAPGIKGSAREELALWMKARVQEIDAENKARIELLRTVGEHPSPIFQNIVQQHGALGMPKSLVAKMLGLTVGTLNQFYGNDYDLGELSAIRSVAANAMRIASSVTDPNAGRLAIQVLDRRGGPSWTPPAQKLEVDDQRDKPPIIDSSKLTWQERKSLREMLERVANGGEGDPISEDGEPSPRPGMDLIE